MLKETATGTDELAPTSDRIWTAAAELFRERGYAAATTRELAERLGITRATLYYHIKKKEDLLYGICHEALARVQKAVVEACDATPDPGKRIQVLVRAHLMSMLTDIPMHATMLLNFDGLTGEYREDIVVLRNEYEALIRGLVADAQEAGFLRADIPAHSLTLTLLNLLNWTITWYRPTTENASSDRLSPESLADLYVDAYLNGALLRV